jgi:hypothetical protein
MTMNNSSSRYADVKDLGDFIGGQAENPQLAGVLEDLVHGT